MIFRLNPVRAVHGCKRGVIPRLRADKQFLTYKASTGPVLKTEKKKVQRSAPAPASAEETIEPAPAPAEETIERVEKVQTVVQRSAPSPPPNPERILERVITVSIYLRVSVDFLNVHLLIFVSRERLLPT